MHQNDVGGKVVFDNEIIDNSYYERNVDEESYQILDEFFSEKIRDLTISELISGNNLTKNIQIESSSKDINKLLKLKYSNSHIEGTPSLCSSSTILFTGGVDYEEWDKSYTLRKFTGL